MSIGQRKEFVKQMFRALALRQSEYWEELRAVSVL